MAEAGGGTGHEGMPLLRFDHCAEGNAMPELHFGAAWMREVASDS